MTALTIPFVYADNLPLVPADEHTIAYIIDATTGELYDEAGNFETAINYIQGHEHIAIAVQDERHWCRSKGAGEDCLYCSMYGPVIRTKAALQAAFNAERRAQEDCFGLPHIPEVAL